MSDYNEHLISLAGGDDKTPTRLEQIQARAEDCQTYKFGLRNADKLAHEDVPYLLAKLAAIRELADAHGKVGFRVTANDIRATLDA